MKSTLLKWLRETNPIVLTYFFLISCLLARFLSRSVTVDEPIAEPISGIDVSRSHLQQHDIVVDSGWPTDASASPDNAFINQFRDSIKSDSLSIAQGHLNDGFIPFILRGGKLLCRRVHRNRIRETTRIRAIAEMIRIGLNLYQRKGLSLKVRSDLPLLLLNSDSNGCLIRKKQDPIHFPRFTWSYPSPKHGMDWCTAIPVPSYLSWKTFHKEHKTHFSWDAAFALKSQQYPWSSKINKAVWRGATTYDAYFNGAELNETPRGKLVQKSMASPGVIDAGFVKLNQQYSSRETELSNQTILTERIHFDDQMKYKAILDIDGNNWSGRFPKLLCTNSVTIKIDPDYIEYFYHELEPMKHYVPASLENVTQVAAYVLDKANEEEMKSIVQSANSWCKTKMTEKGIAKDFMMQLEKYEVEFDAYMQQHNMHNQSTTPLALDNDVDDLVECN